MDIELLEDIIWVMFAHFIGDCSLQTSEMEQKGDVWYLMLCHCMIWTACISIALQFSGIFALWKVPFLLGGHWISDKWKATKLKGIANIKEFKYHGGLKYLYFDQGIHFLQCLIVMVF